MNIVAGVLFPLGLVLWLRMWRFRLRLYRDMRQTVRTGERLCLLLEGNQLEQGEEDAETSQRVHRNPLSGKWTKLAIALLTAALIAACGYGGWHAWKRYQFKKQMQEHGELTPNTPKGADGTTLQLPSAQGPVQLPAKAPK